MLDYFTAAGVLKMLSALEEVARSAKAADCVVPGMFPKHSEQVRQNCGLFRRAFARGMS